MSITGHRTRSMFDRFNITSCSRSMSHPSPPGSHHTALVPLSVWPLNAPDLIDSGKHVDIGTFCAALIYYDRVLVNITTQPQFAEFLRWFIERNSYDDLLSLMRDGE